MKCTKCGYEISKGEKFCPVCGAKNVDKEALRQEQARREARMQEERLREEQRQANYAKQEQERQREQAEREEQARKQAEEEDNDTIVVDARKTYLHDIDDGYNISDLFGGGFGGFGGSPFGSFGIFDILGDILGGFGGFGGGFGGGYGGGYGRRRERRAKIVKPDAYYYIDKTDEEGFPIFRADKIVNISPREFERIKAETHKPPKKK